VRHQFVLVAANYLVLVLIQIKEFVPLGIKVILRILRDRLAWWRFEVSKCFWFS